ncbi:hypothetical protein HYH02_015427 [Chlamydomonas schloesseri]|uniref:alpha-1,2-Mannosidase n=1 Tax=Chlamydomonas schloesseri TaxID=2026947 RepID=A0A835SLD7_9CHLO|nr:hypothetical protein HYH02_015427 [Chlamydomonas schloesseri]|eukprot:KAG2422540.1 hypothetical protein HYH02_015427 [Chlamydomonas schloesseri]
MFDHGYTNYMQHAFPKDNLLPISCGGKDWQGGLAITLVDSLDALMLLNRKQDVLDSLELVRQELRFDKDIKVHVFETVIRVLGGLLSGHMLLDRNPGMVGPDPHATTWNDARASEEEHGDGGTAADPSAAGASSGNSSSGSSRQQQQQQAAEGPYDGIFLHKAVELADLLLPAFDTPSGLPALFVHLKTGAVHDNYNSTCTACAGTLLLEFGMLTALTGDPIYLEKAEFAAKALYDRRSRLGLVGASLNVVSSQWASRESTIGPGSDSYYEYLLKAYLMFGKSEYLEWFAELYSSTMRWMQIPGTFKGYSWMVDVHMDNGRLARPFVSSLGAFWPGMQALAGQEREAGVELHANFTARLAHLWVAARGVRHRPQQVHPEDPGYNLRPEHNRVHLPAALPHPGGTRTTCVWPPTSSPRLHTHNRVQCGYTQINHVDTGEHGDLMESYFLSETAKYLYLMFSDAPGLIDYYVLTTEGHLMPPVADPDSLNLDRLRRRHRRRQRHGLQPERAQGAAQQQGQQGGKQPQHGGDQAGVPAAANDHSKPSGVAAVRAAVDAIFAAVAAVSGHSHQHHNTQQQHAPTTHAHDEHAEPGQRHQPHQTQAQQEGQQQQQQRAQQPPHDGVVDLNAAAATAAARQCGGFPAPAATAPQPRQQRPLASAGLWQRWRTGRTAASSSSAQMTPESLAAAVHALRQAAEGNESALTGHGVASPSGSSAHAYDADGDAADDPADEAGVAAAGQGAEAWGLWAGELPVPQPVPENCAKICTPPPEEEQVRPSARAEEARLRAAFPLLGFRRRDAELVRHRRCVGLLRGHGAHS